jgi:hypothetical protein
MIELLDGPRRRAELVEAGRQRAAATSWARSAANTVAAWRAAVDRPLQTGATDLTPERGQS